VPASVLLFPFAVSRAAGEVISEMLAYLKTGKREFAGLKDELVLLAESDTDEITVTLHHDLLVERIPWLCDAVPLPRQSVCKQPPGTVGSFSSRR
jgi:hypothetical protein